MSLFWHRNRNLEAEQLHDEASSIEVVKLKSEAHRTAAQADRDIKKLNKLLTANGITLRIHIATGGRHGH